MKSIYQFKHYLYIIFMALILLSQEVIGQSIAIDKAQNYFEEVKEAIMKDNGKLWGFNLFGPLVFVDKETRQGVSNSPVPVDGWQEINGLYTGKMPKEIGFSNTAFNWEDERWSMVIFNLLSDNKYERTSLMVHEMFHQHEMKLDLFSRYNISTHLNKKMGRTLLFLEWNALLRACKQDGKEKIKAIKHALAFRKTRLEYYKEGFPNEMNKELHEGLAEYTGMTLSGWDERGKLSFLEKKIASHDDNNSISWTHAYTSGVLYGFLLDQKSPGWNRKLTKGQDLGEVLSKIYEIKYTAISEKRIPRVGRYYGYDSIIVKEEARVIKAQQLQDSFKKRFVDGPNLLLPNFGLGIQFNPEKITPFENVGTVYGELTGKSKWGKIKVNYGGILLLKGWKGLVLDISNNWNPETELVNERYSIVLNDGYRFVKTANGWTVEKVK